MLKLAIKTRIIDMNFYQYCEKNNLDISQLSQRSISALGSVFLENMNPTQEDVNLLTQIETGELTSDQAMQQVIDQYTQH